MMLFPIYVKMMILLIFSLSTLSTAESNSIIASSQIRIQDTGPLDAAFLDSNTVIVAPDTVLSDR